MDVKKRKFFKEELKKTFILYALIPTLIFSLFFYSILSYYNMRTIQKRNIVSNKYVAAELEKEFSSYEKKILELVNRDEIRDVTTKKMDKIKIYEDLYGFINKRKIRSIFYIFNKNGEIVITNAWKESENKSKKHQLQKQIRQIKINSNEVTMIGQENNLSKITKTIYYLGDIIKDRNGKTLGYILFALLEDDMESLIFNNQVDAITITDKFKNVIIKSNNILINQIGKMEISDTDKSYIRVNDNNYYVYKTSILNNNISVYTLTSMNYLNKFYLLGLVFMTVIFIFLIFIFWIIAKKISINQSKSVDELLYAIKKVQNGDLNTFMNIKSNDEFEIIGDYYNEMLIKLNKLIKENEEQVRRNNAVEIKNLESQFKPHFLFNTLEIVKYMIKISPQNAIKIIISLSNLLRYSISNKQEKIPFLEDIQYIKDYMIIQRFRFDKNFEYKINIEKETENCIVPKLIIQPFIENSIKYGFKTKDFLKITLISYITNNNLIIKVIDNGKFITNEKLYEINNILENTNNKTNHIGIFNIHRRIKLIYGEGYGIKIRNQTENDINEGVEVKIKLPVISNQGE